MGNHSKVKRRAHARPSPPGRTSAAAMIAGICVLGLVLTYAVAGSSSRDVRAVGTVRPAMMPGPSLYASVPPITDLAQIDKDGNVLDADLPIVNIPQTLVIPTDNVRRVTLTVPPLAPSTTTVTTTLASTTSAPTTSSALPTTTAATTTATAALTPPSQERDTPPSVTQTAAPDDVDDPPVPADMTLLSFGGVEQHVAQVGTFLKSEFGITTVYGVAQRPNNPTSDHPKGLALDFMVFSDKKTGDALDACVMRHKDDWGVTYTLWQVKDHFDHVHVSFSPTATVRDLSC